MLYTQVYFIIRNIFILYSRVFVLRVVLILFIYCELVNISRFAKTKHYSLVYYLYNKLIIIRSDCFTLCKSFSFVYTFINCIICNIFYSDDKKGFARFRKNINGRNNNNVPRFRRV